MPKKKFLVSLGKPDSDIKGIEVDGKIRKFSSSGHSFYVTDSGEAREINEKYGKNKTGDGTVIVSEVPMSKNTGGHTFFFPVKKPKLKSGGKSKYEWVEVRPGVKKMVKKDEL